MPTDAVSLRDPGVRLFTRLGSTAKSLLAALRRMQDPRRQRHAETARQVPGRPATRARAPAA